MHEEVTQVFAMVVSNVSPSFCISALITSINFCTVIHDYPREIQLHLVYARFQHRSNL